MKTSKVPPLPPSSSKAKSLFEERVPSDYPTLTTQEVLELVESGKTISQCFIRQLSIPAGVTKAILLRNVYIKELRFDAVTLDVPLSLQKCNIKYTHIMNTEFNETTNFKFTNFHFINIQKSVFHKGVNAEGALFSSKFSLHDTIFEQRLRLWDATFKDWVSFERCTFRDKFDMRSATLECGVSFNDSVFEGDALFRGAVVALKLEMLRVRFEGLVDFSKAKLNDFVYLEEIEQGPEQRWAFWNTISEKILITPQLVEGRLASEVSGKYEDAMREYGVLKRSFEYNNYYGYDDWAFYRFKVNERRARRADWSQPLSKVREGLDWLFLDWGCGYGTRPIRAIRTSLFMIGFFALIYTLGFDFIHSPEASGLPFPEYDSSHLMNRVAVSLFISLAAFTSGFGDLREVGISWMNIPIMVEALLGTLMWGLFVVAFGRKVIR